MNTHISDVIRMNCEEQEIYSDQQNNFGKKSK